MGSREPAGHDLGRGEARRTWPGGTATRWAYGKHPCDCLHTGAGALSFGAGQKLTVWETRLHARSSLEMMS